MSSVFVRALVLVCLWVVAPGIAKAQEPQRALMQAMETELARSQSELRLNDYDPPYFVAYKTEYAVSDRLTVRYGAVYRDSTRSDGDVYVEVRVGDYGFDNTGRLEDNFPFSFFDREAISTAAPVDRDPLALRTTLWRLTDHEYKNALSEYHQKRGKAVFKTEEAQAPSFTRAPKVVSLRDTPSSSFDRPKWIARLKGLSRRFAAHESIHDHDVSLSVGQITRLFANSEGTRISDGDTLAALTIEAKTRAEDDMLLSHQKTLYAPTPDRLSGQEDLERLVDELVAELIALRSAPLTDPYTGPAILSPEATGVLFHEAVGHRLEGDRQNSKDEGRTFEGQIGQKILPDFLDLVDDPTLPEINGVPLNGHYLFDDEGVAAQRVELVKGGVLKTYLMGRTPTEKVQGSNGHGRASGVRRPMARMGNTVLVSHRSVHEKELKKRLIDLVKKQGKPYGLYIKDMQGGSTNTSSYGYQAFKGTPTIVYRVYPDGREELVRGVELVGTPLASINKILVTGDEPGVFNGFCGAESGSVPVSAIAPAVLLEELELQRVKEENNRPPLLPNPFTTPVGAPGRNKDETP